MLLTLFTIAEANGRATSAFGRCIIFEPAAGGASNTRCFTFRAPPPTDDPCVPPAARGGNAPPTTAAAPNNVGLTSSWSRATARVLTLASIQAHSAARGPADDGTGGAGGASEDCPLCCCRVPLTLVLPRATAGGSAGAEPPSSMRFVGAAAHSLLTESRIRGLLVRIASHCPYPCCTRPFRRWTAQKCGFRRWTALRKNVYG